MQHIVFVSYSSFDESAAESIVRFLESNNLPCWIAPRDILIGESWPKAIMAALESASILIVVFSSNTGVSPQILRELQVADKRGVPILPIRIEDVQPRDELEYYFGTFQWFDAIQPPIDQHLVPMLIDQIRVILATADKILPEINRLGPGQQGVGLQSKKRLTEMSRSPSRPIFIIGLVIVTCPPKPSPFLVRVSS